MLQSLMKNIWPWALMLLVIGWTNNPPVFAQSVLLTAEERAWLAANPVLYLSPDPAYQPVEFFDEQGVYRGISADYVSLIEQRLGFRFQVIDRSKQQAAFDAGQLRIDAMPTCAATPEREKSWMFTTPYLEFPAYLITRKNVSDNLTLDQLGGSRVVVVSTYAAREYLETKYPKVVIDPVQDARIALQRVSFGLADAFISELPVATYWMEREGITNLKAASKTDYVYRLGFGMSKKFAPLHGILEKGLAQIRPEERAAIYQKWAKLPTETSPFSQRIWYALLIGLGIACLGFLLVFSWNRSLQAQVKRRTAALRQELRERRQAEQQLRASEERFATMFRSSPNPLAITHFDDNNFLDVNDRWVQLSGYAKEELIGQGEREVALWENQDVRQRLVALIRQRQPVRDFEFSYLTKGGEQRTALLSAETIQLSNELCTLWTVQDFTERKRAEEALQQSETLFRSLTETTGAWVYILQKGRVCYVNSATLTGTEYSRAELVGNLVDIVVHPDDWPLIRARQQARKQGESVSPVYEARSITKSGRVVWLQVASNIIEYNNAPAELCTAIDITARKTAEEALQQSEELFRSLTETTTAWVFIIENGQIRYVNTAAITGLGYTHAEVRTLNLLDVVHPEDIDAVKERLHARRKGQAVPPVYEVRLLTKSGEIRWLQVATKPILYHQSPGVLNTGFDITERKRAEEQLQISEQQLHQLAGYLQTIREEERTAMAREIHDELGQALTAMKMDIMWLRGRLTEATSATQERISGLIELMNTTINTVRKLASQLRPGVLDDLGLAAALEWQAQDFQARTNIMCEFIERSEIPELASDQATAIFRICQESLTNVMRHAQATRVSIKLQVVQNLLILEIKDNGRGVTESELANPRSLGLMGMRERAYLLGGEFKLQGNANDGTTVTAQIPLRRATAKGGAS